jgi:hypothetical protein
MTRKVWPLFPQLSALIDEGSNGAALNQKKEGHMKKQVLKNFTMLSLLLMLTAVSVAAQSDRSRITNIPFSFIVGGKTLPAGDYTVEPNRRDSHKVWLVQSRDGRASALFATIPVRAGDTQEKTSLVFNKYGDQYFLSQIWTAGGNSGRELPMLKLERELVKNTIERQRIVIANGSAARN